MITEGEKEATLRALRAGQITTEGAGYNWGGLGPKKDQA